MGLSDKAQLAHQPLQLCTQSGSISGVSAPFKEPRQEIHRTPSINPPITHPHSPKEKPGGGLFAPHPPLSISSPLGKMTPVIAFSINCSLSQDPSLPFLNFRRWEGGEGSPNQMTTVDNLKFPVNRFITAASSV